MSWKCCKKIKNFFRFKCTMKCCETSIDCENDTKAVIDDIQQSVENTIKEILEDD